MCVFWRSLFGFTKTCKYIQNLHTHTRTTHETHHAHTKHVPNIHSGISIHTRYDRGGSARGRHPRPLCPYHVRNEAWWQVPVARDLFVTVTVTVHVTLLRPGHVIGRPALRASPSNSMASSSSDARATPVKQPSKKSFPGDRKDRNAAHSRVYRMLKKNRTQDLAGEQHPHRTPHTCKTQQHSTHPHHARR